MVSVSKQAGLVLTGGGARAAYQVGVLCALSEILPTQSLPFPVLSGTSAGAINIAYLASHAADWSSATAKLRELWHSLRLERVYRTDSFSLTAIAMSWISRTLLGGKGGTRRVANYLLNTEPLHLLLEAQVPVSEIPASIASGALRGVALTATHYFKSQSVSFFDAHPSVEPWARSNRIGVRTALSAEHVMASSAIPVFFPPVMIDESPYGDGCLRQTTPLSPAIHLGADRILCVGIRHEREGVANPSGAQAPMPTLAQIGGQLLNALFLDSLESDVERLERINQTIHVLGEENRSKYVKELRAIPIMTLRPSRDLGGLVPNLVEKFPPFMRYLLKGLGTTDHEGSELVSYLAFEPQFLDPLMELGYNDTRGKRDVLLRFMES